MTTSCDACGWTAALISMLAFGTFGVPIRHSGKIDPLVFQTYKTIVCFVTSWVMLLQPDVRFTYYGILSGLFWVPGGWATVYAIQNAGLALAIGMGSSCIVLVSFVWGIFIFGEAVHSRGQACGAILLLMIGVFGMAWFASPDTTNDDDAGPNYQTVSMSPTEDEEDDEADEEEDDYNDEAAAASENDDEIQQANNEDEVDDDDIRIHAPTATNDETTTIPFLYAITTPRTRGMLAAALITGVWGGSILAPMKYSPLQGTDYLLSFSTGATLVTLAIWILRWFYNAYQYQSFHAGYHALPGLEFRRLWRPALSCGLLWSIGNYFSLISVYYLGEGVGYPLVQTSILVSGLWGILYFQEIQGRRRILQWLACSLVTIAGILLLSYEHHAG